MLQTLWPMLVNLAVIATTLRWFVRRQPRLRAWAGAFRWTLIFLGLTLVIHALLDSRLSHLLHEGLAVTGVVLALCFLLFPGTAFSLLRRLLKESNEPRSAA